MTTAYSISVDWRDDSDRWRYIGSEVMRKRAEAVLKSCKHGNRDKDGCGECGVYPDEIADEQRPVVNFAYPLCTKPTTAKIVRICEKTNCTVVKNISTGEYFLALTSAGMDLSQDIGLAYTYADEWIPCALAMEISTQYGLSVSGKDWVNLMNEIKGSLKHEMIIARKNYERIRSVLIQEIYQHEELKEAA